MHCSANVDADGTTALFLGSLELENNPSADAKRQLIGDDEHGWTPTTQIFNFEGGCYAKVSICQDKKSPIFLVHQKRCFAGKCHHKSRRHVDYRDTTITQNTRVSYPLHHIRNALLLGENQAYLFLTADAFGVLPPIAMLNPYHRLSFYFWLHR